jgi:hypothetical protein
MLRQTWPPHLIPPLEKGRCVVRILVVLGLLATPLAPLALRAAGPSELHAQTGFFYRDLYVKGSNPDGHFICAEWCGILESCC